MSWTPCSLHRSREGGLTSLPLLDLFHEVVQFSHLGEIRRDRNAASAASAPFDELIELRGGLIAGSFVARSDVHPGSMGYQAGRDLSMVYRGGRVAHQDSRRVKLKPAARDETKKSEKYHLSNA